MLTFCILKKDNSKEGLQVVETGFSLVAFIFGPAWGIFKKLWLYSFIGIIFLLAFKSVLEIINLSNLFFIVSIVSSFFWGFFARDLHIQFLISKKFKPIKLINANSRENAIVKFLSETN